MICYAIHWCFARTHRRNLPGGGGGAASGEDGGPGGGLIGKRRNNRRTDMELGVGECTVKHSLPIDLTLQEQRH